VCLAKAYLSKQDNEPMLQDIAYVRLHEDRVELETLFGEEQVVHGRLVEINFATSKILLHSDRQAAQA